MTAGEYPGLSVSAAHAAMLAASAIAADVAVARGYRTVTTKADLRRLGFSETQARVPALLVPIWGVAGDIVTYQARPDAPRLRDGKPLKYETPAGSQMRLDVPPGARARLADPAVPLFITEGARKADAAVTAGLCCVALLGVWNWRGRNDQGGKTALADWENVALNGRDVFVAFDSDVMTKTAVLDACERLAAFLKRRNARVRFLLLPPMPDGAKCGLDDYIAAGHSVGELLALAADTLPRPPGEPAGGPGVPYRATPGGLVWDRPTREGAIPTPLTTFSARIVGDTLEDDGAETRRLLDIEATLAGRVARFSVPAAAFMAMNWPVDQLGAGAIVYPGMGTRDHARAAIQLLSGDVPSRHAYAQTGWRTIGDQRAYLHAGGAIGAGGPLPDVAVALGDGLSRYELPDPPAGADAVAAVRASLRLLDIAPAPIAYPLLAAVARAPLGPADLGLHLAGATGAGKSELAALAQQHYGATMTARRLPGSWDSTANALEATAHGAADALLVVDDFAPNARGGSDARRLHRDADRLLRAAGNQAGRQRMRADTTLRPAKAPRGLILSTGEDIPAGQSLQARLLILELGPGDIDWDRLGGCQRDASAGLYARALAGYVQWLAQTHGDQAGQREAIAGELLRLREAATDGHMHRRTPDIVAQLAIGWALWLRYAVAVGALDADEADQRWAAGWAALGAAASDQARQQTASEPTRLFLELLASAIASGAAHLAGPAGHEPTDPGAWGWRLATVGGGEWQRDEWRPHGALVGWLDGDYVFLDSVAAYRAAQRLDPDGLTITRPTLTKRLAERGKLAMTESDAGELTVRRTLAGHRRRVLALHTESLSPPESGQSGQSGQWPDSGRNSGAEWPDNPADWPDSATQSGHDFPYVDAENDAIGRIGRIPDGGETPGAQHAAPDGRIPPAVSENPATNPARTRPANGCADCGAPCGSAYRCSSCAATATPVRAGRQAGRRASR